MVPLREQFEGSKEVLELATRLGRVCLSRARELTRLDAMPDVRPFAKQLEGVVAGIDQRRWLDRDRDDFADLLEVDGLGDLIEFAEAHSPIEYLAVLRGLLPVLRRFYDEVESEVPVGSGTPIPVATRRVNDLFSTTTKLETLRLNDLLQPLDEDGDRYRSGLYLADFGLDDRIAVVLDFTHRDRLDELAWTREKRLPRIATVHPALGKRGIVIDEKTESTFFGVRPRRWDCAAVIRQLREIGDGVEIAVLPELSLPQADALEGALAADPGSFPSLVVAGSAHVTERAGANGVVRANESHIYLDGRQIGAHRKVHAFILKALDGVPLSRPLREGITSEPKRLTVLAGDHTRLAVAICADILDSRLPKLLEEAGVNLLLVPALTVDPGSFNGSVCGIASQAQGVTVVVNGDSAALIEDGELPFMAMVGVPRPRAGEQSREYDRPAGSSAPYTGVFDPNLPLGSEKAFEWRPQGAPQ